MRSTRAFTFQVKRLPKSVQEQADAMFGNVASAALAQNPDLAPVIANMWAEQQQKAPHPKKNRDFTEVAEMERDPDTKRLLSRRGRAVMAEQINRHGATILARRAKRENRQLRESVADTPVSRQSPIFGKT